jgi:hypothetical protein
MSFLKTQQRFSPKQYWSKLSGVLREKVEVHDAKKETFRLFQGMPFM